MYKHKAANGRDLQTGGDKVLPGGSCSIFEQPGLGVAEGWPSNVTWGSSTWHSCSPSRGLEFPTCLRLSAPRSHKGEKLLENSNWRWHSIFGHVFHWNKTKRWNLWVDWSPFYTVSYSFMTSHHLFKTCSPGVSTFLATLYLRGFSDILCGKEKRRFIFWEMRSGQGSQTHRSEWRRRHLECSAGTSDFILDSHGKISFKLFHFSFATLGWEVLQKIVSLCRCSGLIYLLKCVAVFHPALAVCTSGTCAGKEHVGSWGRHLSISTCPSHLKELPLDVTHEPCSYLRD